MGNDYLGLLASMADVQRVLTFIVKNANYDGRAADVAIAHYKDIQTAVGNCGRVIEQVLNEQRKACN